jgi:lipopolysaccharide transport system ATP-binding protein
MGDLAIRIEGLSKQYRIGGPQGRFKYKTIRESLVDAARAPFQRAASLLRGQAYGASGLNETIWALKDVSFEVKQGEAVGIIGRNGAGKSTLLKILSRITEPTEGCVDLYGRVGSLLEVGTGFHPELTGRENIYLNGAILGMRRTEIEHKFDEIVDFAEIEKFLDTPVKHYSSGMYVRLAFSVAAHLEPEILLVDEVLAVGDAAFQKKCLGKIGDVAEEGRTVLFVSHNMATILSLCNEAYLLEQGRIVCNGTTEDVVGTYMQTISSLVEIPLHQRTDRRGSGRVRLTSISITNETGSPSIRCSDGLQIRLGYTSEHELTQATFLVGIYDQFNRPIFFLDSEAAAGLPGLLPASGSVTCVSSAINLTPGPCIVNVAVLVGKEMADHVGHVCAFDVEADDFYGTGKLTSRQVTLCLLHQKWQVERDNCAKNPA